MGKRANNTGLTKGNKAKGEWRPTEGVILPFTSISKDVKAVQYDGLNGEDIVKKLQPGEKALSRLEYLPNQKSLLYKVLEHTAKVEPGEWLVLGNDGEIELVENAEFKKSFEHSSDEKPLKTFLIIYDFERQFAKIGQVGIVFGENKKDAEAIFRDKTGIKGKFDKVVVLELSSITENYFYYAIKKDKE